MINDIHKKAIIGSNCDFGSFSVVEEDVVIGDNCWIGPNAVIMNGARIGDNCRVFPGAVVSAIPQDLKYKGENTQVFIGNSVTIRECCTINRGTLVPEQTGSIGKTVVGDECLLMAYVHVAHDCVIGNKVILANNATLAGHIEIGDYAVIGGLVAIHQFVRIGKSVMIGGGSLVRKDVPHYVRAAREPVSYEGINTIGLERRDFTIEQMNHLKDIYRILFVKGFSTNKALNLIRTTVPKTPFREEIIEFIETSERGIIRGYGEREE